MKRIHRLIVTSATYRQASTPDVVDGRADPDNVYLWRMNSRRLEAELVRDNVLWVAGSLDLKLGGPDIDHNLGLTSKRRSLYLRQAAEKEVEFLRIFDGPSVTECYERRPSVMPQQALALANSELAFSQARVLTASLDKAAARDDARFVAEAFRRILGRRATADELHLCLEFLNPSSHPGVAGKHAENLPPASPPNDLTVAVALNARGGKPSSERTRENLVRVLLNHNDFLAVR